MPVTSTGRRGLRSTAALNFYDPRVARILIVGGGCRALSLARDLHAEGHAVRIVTRRESRRAEIEATGAECFVGSPDRLVTLRAALEHVTIVCWMLATAKGDDPHAVRALHGSRLEQFMGSTIDTTVRGVVYEAGGSDVPRDLLAAGERIVTEKAARNAIPVEIVRADPLETAGWVASARRAVGALLQPRYSRS